MNKLPFIAGILLLLIGCQDVQLPEPPEQLIPKEKMIQILADAYISNASRSKGVNNRILRTKGVKLDSILYAKHGIDSLSFAQSNFYYASDLDQYVALITEVEKIISRKKAILDSISNVTKVKNNTEAEKAIPASVKETEEGILLNPVQDEEE